MPRLSIVLAVLAAIHSEAVPDGQTAAVLAAFAAISCDAVRLSVRNGKDNQTDVDKVVQAVDSQAAIANKKLILLALVGLMGKSLGFAPGVPARSMGNTALDASALTDWAKDVVGSVVTVSMSLNAPVHPSAVKEIANAAVSAGVEVRVRGHGRDKELGKVVEAEITKIYELMLENPDKLVDLAGLLNFADMAEFKGTLDAEHKASWADRRVKTLLTKLFGGGAAEALAKKLFYHGTDAEKLADALKVRRVVQMALLIEEVEESPGRLEDADAELRAAVQQTAEEIDGMPHPDNVDGSSIADWIQKKIDNGENLS